jgi:hypothetical protein
MPVFPRTIAARVIALVAVAIVAAACGAASASRDPDPSGAPAGFGDKLCAAVSAAGTLTDDLQKLTAAGSDMIATGKAATNVVNDLQAIDAAMAAIPDWEPSRSDIAQWRGYMPDSINAMKAVAAAAAANAPAAFQQAIGDAARSSGALLSVQQGLFQQASDLRVSCGAATA